MNTWVGNREIVRSVEVIKKKKKRRQKKEEEEEEEKNPNENESRVPAAHVFLPLIGRQIIYLIHEKRHRCLLIDS